MENIKYRLYSVCVSGFRLNIGKNDLLTFYDGDDLTAKVLGQYGGAKSRFKLYTSTADVTIQFQSDPATNVYGYGNGFIVHFFGKPWNQRSEITEPHRDLYLKIHSSGSNTIYCFAKVDI